MKNITFSKNEKSILVFVVVLTKCGKDKYYTKFSSLSLQDKKSSIRFPLSFSCKTKFPVFSRILRKFPNFPFTAPFAVSYLDNEF